LARIYLDNDIALQLTAALDALGHDVIHTRSVGRESACDDEQLQTSATGQRLLVTHNRKDFRLLHSAWLRWSGDWHIDAVHFGILVLPQPIPDDAAEAIDRLVRSSGLLELQLLEYRSIDEWRPIPVPLVERGSQ
jgi:Domain of unknown function (DUF5615)